MECFWIIFENNEAITYDLISQLNEIENASLIDYLLKETRKHLDCKADLYERKKHAGNGKPYITYKEVVDTLEFNFLNEDISSAIMLGQPAPLSKGFVENKRVMVLVKNLLIPTNVSLLNIYTEYIEFIINNPCLDKLDYFKPLKEKVSSKSNSQISEPISV